MKIRKFGPFRAVGAYAKTSYSLEQSPETAKISQLEFGFFEQWFGGLIPHRLDRCEWFHLTTDYETDEFGSFTYIIGHRVWQFDTIPEGMMAIEMPRQGYAVFNVDLDHDIPCTETKLEITRFFQDTTKYRRAYTTDLIISNRSEIRYFVSIE